MIRLYRMFTRYLLLTIGAGLAFALAAMLVLHLFGVEYEHSLGAIAGLSIYMNFFIPNVFVGQAGWVSFLPVRRRGLLACAFLLNLTYVISVLIALYLLAATVSFISDGSTHFLLEVLHWVHDLFVPKTPITGPVPFLTYYLGLIALTNYVIFYWSFAPFAVFPRFSQTTAIGRPGFALTNRKKLQAYLLVGTALCFLCHSYIFCGIGIALLIAAGSLLVVYIACRRLGVFGPTRKLWLSLAGGFGALELALILIAVASSFHSDTLVKRVSAFDFMGPWAHPSRATLAGFLYSDLPQEQVASISTAFLESIGNRYGLNLSKEKLLDFQKVVGSKTHADAIRAALPLFHGGTFSASQIAYMFDHLDKLPLRPNPTPFMYHVLPSSIDVGDTATFLHSSDSLLVQYGLLRARFYPDQRYVSVIWENMNRYPDTVRMSALQTLSILTGHAVGIDDFFNYRMNRRIPYRQLLTTDCAKFKGEPLSSLGQVDAPAINFCLRKVTQKANEQWIQNVEDAGIISWPLSTWSRNLIEKGLGISDTSVQKSQRM